MIDKAVFERKERFVKKLKERGIANIEISYLPYLQFEEHMFATPSEVGARMLILFACTYTANNLDDRNEIKDWLIRENLWSHVSPKEQELFNGKRLDEESLADFSWNLEASYTLAWALNIIKDLHPTRELTDDELK